MIILELKFFKFFLIEDNFLHQVRNQVYRAEMVTVTNRKHNQTSKDNIPLVKQMQFNLNN